MTDELSREKTGPGGAEPELVSEMLQAGADVTVVVEPALENNVLDRVTVETIPDWLKPMEEEDVVKNHRTVKSGTRKNNPNTVTVKRGRGRPPLPKTVRARLKMMKALQADGKAQKARVGAADAAAATSKPDSSHPADVSPRRLQNAPHSLNSTLHLTPISTLCAPTIFSANEFCSSPRLMRVSPLTVDTPATQFLTHSTSLQVRDTLTAGNNSSELPLHLWQCPSLQPISPPKVQDKDSDHAAGSSGFPDSAVEGERPEEEEILLRDCFVCGCPFPVKNIRDTLCYRCKPEKKHSPNMIFRKVGQDKWEVGKTKHPKNLKLLPKYKNMFKQDFVPDGGDDDEDDDDDDELCGGSKKRNRRMCRQCDACQRESDCGQCDFCMDKPKFGGCNKKRQKCRLRQCQFQSKLHVQRNETPQRRRIIRQKFKKRGRPKKVRRDPWDDGDVTEQEDGPQEVRWYRSRGTRRRPRRKWSYSDETFVESATDPENESDALSLVQNEPVKMVLSNHRELQSQEICYTMPGLTETPLHPPVTLSNSNLDPVNEAGSHNEILQIEMVRVGSPLSQFIDPQNTEPGEPISHTPVITQIFSLALGTETDFERDPELMELFSALRQTVLPAHWVGVMARGPVLQLLQCSKLSTMADTVVQIEKGFFYQISVQNQPLLLMHFLYKRHPTCLTSIGDVVSLLLDLEGLSVCQGHQSLSLGSSWEPTMCVRAALCDLLILKDEEQCEKCARPTK